MNNDTMISDDTVAGTLYVSGGNVENGEVDIEKTIDYLKGVKDVLKYYVEKQDAGLAGKNYSIEVRIRPGSFVTDIMGIVVGAYLTSAAIQLGKNDIGKKSTAEVMKGAMNSLKSTVKIAKHLGALLHKKSLRPEQAKAINAGHIELINSSGASLIVTKEELDTYRETPPTKLRQLVTLVSRDTSLYIDDRLIKDEDSIPETAESVSFASRRVFDAREEETEERLVFPELTQDMYVSLEGELTRGNGRTNTLGFSYDGRILKAFPPEGGVKGARSALFGPVRIEAYVDRRSTTKGSNAVLKKPMLRIVSIENLDTDGESGDQQQLFAV